MGILWSMVDACSEQKNLNFYFSRTNSFKLEFSFILSVLFSLLKSTFITKLLFIQHSEGQNILIEYIQITKLIDSSVQDKVCQYFFSMSSEAFELLMCQACCFMWKHFSKSPSAQRPCGLGRGMNAQDNWHMLLPKHT